MTYPDFVSLIWQFILLLIKPPDGTKNCPKDFNGTDTPLATVFLSHLRPMQVAFLAIGTPMTLLIIGIGVFQCYHVVVLISSNKRRKNLYFLISLLPVSSVCCLFGMYLPRTAILLTSFGLFYFLTCLFALVSLVRHLGDGREQLSLSLARRGRVLNFQGPPCCCLLSCLPIAQPTEQNLKRLEFIVLQAPIVRLVILFGQVISVVELREHALGYIAMPTHWTRVNSRSTSSVLHVFEILSVVSLLLAIFGMHTLARLVSDQLSRYGFMGIFRLVDFALFFFSAQQPIIFQNILIRFDLIECGPILPTEDNARFICNFVIICEMFLLSVVSLFLVHPKRNSLFDKYPGVFETLVASEMADEGGREVAVVTASSTPGGVTNAAENVGYRPLSVSAGGYGAALSGSTPADNASAHTQMTLFEHDR